MIMPMFAELPLHVRNEELAKVLRSEGMRVLSAR